MPADPTPSLPSWASPEAVRAIEDGILRAWGHDPDRLRDAVERQGKQSIMWCVLDDAQGAARAAIIAVGPFVERAYGAPLQAVTDMFAVEDPDSVGNNLEAVLYNDGINIDVENPWAGDTETGFGYTCHVRLSNQQAADFGRWLVAVTTLAPTPDAGPHGDEG